jgi:hypothetical protein
MKYLLILLFISTTASADIERTHDIYDQAIGNHTYEVETNWKPARDITKPFVGDCRTFAVSMLQAVGEGLVFFVYSEEEMPHLMYANHGHAWECTGQTYKLKEYPFKILLHLGAIEPSGK